MAIGLGRYSLSADRQCTAITICMTNALRCVRIMMSSAINSNYTARDYTT